YRQRERHLAGDHELRQQGMPPAHRDAVGRDDFPEDAYAARLPELGEDPRKPIGIVRLDAELALPSRVREILVALRQVLFSDQPGVVGERETVETRAHPLAVREIGRA